ncbi:leucyl/phenylalanyl-tRNA--protein transferase [Candidatus Marinarcus aquaticus]|uniref:Leucyl/phenylalanyl-tRNA--protein transferase n=1 Tax=Candidatus Marinarcus aquaticus TaxID=2044504 RepID=A0A4Q0XS30_9BACT|nr:leucyl/phenylalanyl-tRNA--protein transferase [Candidatus Marinarcus aquaticus]
MLPLSQYSHSFPNPLDACDEGLLAYGGDLNPNRIMKAYMSGIFPWYNQHDPILWWSPNPRFILELDEFKVSKSLKKRIDLKQFEVHFDRNFTQTMIECSKVPRPGQTGTWILPEVIQAYSELHRMGYAHSFESYYKEELVGGGYGIAIGNMFCGESMFAKQTDASKVALYHLVEHLKKQGFAFIDCQIPTPHLSSLGAKKISRDSFLERVKQALENPRDF